MIAPRPTDIPSLPTDLRQGREQTIEQTIPAVRCLHSPLRGTGRRLGPSLDRGSYLLAISGDEQLLAASWDLATWADRIHRTSVAAGLTRATS